MYARLKIFIAILSVLGVNHHDVIFAVRKVSGKEIYLFVLVEKPRLQVDFVKFKGERCRIMFELASDVRS